MYEVITTFNRPNVNVDFFVFQTSNLGLLELHTKFRKEMASAPGFIGISYFVSQNQLALRLHILWESETALMDFEKKSKYSNSFRGLLNNFNKANGTSVGIDSSYMADPKYLKTKKLANRISVKDAQNRLTDFLNGKK